MPQYTIAQAIVFKKIWFEPLLMNNENTHDNTYILSHIQPQKKAGYKNDQCGHGKGEN